MANPDRPQFGIGEEHISPSNSNGYVRLVRDILELYSNDEIVKRRLSTLHRVNAATRRSDPTFTPTTDPTPEEILTDWDPDGSRKVLREQLDLTGTTPERNDRLTQFMDERISLLSFQEQHAIKAHYLPGELATPSQSVLDRAMRTMRHPSNTRRISTHLQDEMQGNLF